MIIKSCYQRIHQIHDFYTDILRSIYKWASRTESSSFKPSRPIKNQNLYQNLSPAKPSPQKRSLPNPSLMKPLNHHLLKLSLNQLWPSLIITYNNRQKMNHSSPPKLSDSTNLQLSFINNRPNLHKLFYSKSLQVLRRKNYPQAKLPNLQKLLSSKKLRLWCSNNKKNSKVTWVRILKSLHKNKDRK